MSCLYRFAPNDFLLKNVDYALRLIAKTFTQISNPETFSVVYYRPIVWNFAKFLINRQGQIAERYSPITPPLVCLSTIE